MRNNDNKVPVLNVKKAAFSPMFIVRPGMDKKAAELFQLSAESDYDGAKLQMSFADLTTGERCIMGFEGSWRLHQGFLWLKRETNNVLEPVATV